MPKKQEFNSLIHERVPLSLRERLDAIAILKGQRRSVTVRAALEFYVNQFDAQSKSQVV